MPVEVAPMGGGVEVGRTTGAKALFCLTALIMLAGLKDRDPADTVGCPGCADRVLGGSEGE